MKVFKIFFSLFVICMTATSCMSDSAIKTQAKEEFPNEIVLGKLIQLTNEKMLYGSIRGTTGGIFTRGYIRGNIGEDYYYVGLYETPEGYIKNFKIPSRDTYLVNSDSYNIELTDFHKYIDGENALIYGSYSGNAPYSFRDAMLNVIKNSTNRNIKRGCGDPTCHCQDHTPKIKLCIPTDSIERYVRIEF